MFLLQLRAGCLFRAEAFWAGARARTYSGTNRTLQRGPPPPAACRPGTHTQRTRLFLVAFAVQYIFASIGRLAFRLAPMEGDTAPCRPSPGERQARAPALLRVGRRAGTSGGRQRGDVLASGERGGAGVTWRVSIGLREG
jgi:hypothetical protein